MPLSDPSAPSPATSPPADASAPGLTIAAVERDTGLSKDTLRVWERRYGFPRPERNAHQERLYPREQLDQLRLIKRLLDAGHRPGQVVGLPAAELQRLGQEASEPTRPGQRGKARASAVAPGLENNKVAPQVQPCFELVKQHDGLGLRQALATAAQELGLTDFVHTLVVPLNTLIGDAWMAGQLEIFEEHFYTESVTAVLRQAISHQGVIATASPRVLLTTFPQESHALGLLMAESFLAQQDCHCLSLGVQTPVPDIARAALAHRADIVVLSFSASLNPKEVTQGLAELRDLLPPAVEIWAGGACPVLQRRRLVGIGVLDGLVAIEPELQRWRQSHP